MAVVGVEPIRNLYVLGLNTHNIRLFIANVTHELKVKLLCVIYMVVVALQICSAHVGW